MNEKPHVNPNLVTTVKCAGPRCDVIRREANHWFICSLMKLRGSVSFVCFPFRITVPLKKDEQPVCGQQCAQRFFEAWMARATMNPNTKEESASVPTAVGKAP